MSLFQTEPWNRKQKSIVSNWIDSAFWILQNPNPNPNWRCLPHCLVQEWLFCCNWRKIYGILMDSSFIWKQGHATILYCLFQSLLSSREMGGGTGFRGAPTHQNTSKKYSIYAIQILDLPLEKQEFRSYPQKPCFSRSGHLEMPSLLSADTYMLFQGICYGFVILIPYGRLLKKYTH